MRLSEASEGEYVVMYIEEEAKMLLYQLGVIEGTVILVEIITPTAVVISLKPVGRIGMSKSTASMVEVEPI